MQLQDTYVAPLRFERADLPIALVADTGLERHPRLLREIVDGNIQAGQKVCPRAAPTKIPSRSVTGSMRREKAENH